MSPTALSPPDRRTVMGIVATVCASAAWGKARAAEVEPQQFARFGEPLDVSRIRPGDWQVYVIDDDPVVVRRRTPAEIATVRAEPSASLIDPARDEERAPGDGEWLVVSATCTHAGCRVVGGLGDFNGWACFCHGSVFDLSGRVRSGPAKTNLPVVRHRFRDGALLLQAG